MTESEYDKIRMKIWGEAYTAMLAVAPGDHEHIPATRADVALEDFERRFPKGDVVKHEE